MSELIFHKESKRYPGLFIKKYRKQVFYNNLWHTSGELLEARGHIEDANGNIVVRPFTKIFNRFENGTNIDRDETVVVIRKVNGFMAAATYVPAVNAVVVSTTGSTDSDFVSYAEEYITGDVKKKIFEMSRTEPKTFLFEICHPKDPHIVPEEYGAYLIGCRKVSDDTPYFSNSEFETTLDLYSVELGVKRPEWSVVRFSDVTSKAKTCQHEGYVVYGQASKIALKIKSPYYLQLKLLARKRDIMSLDKRKVDEEFYPILNHVTELGQVFMDMNEQQRLDYMRKWLQQ